MKRVKWTELLTFIIGTELVGALSGLLSGGFQFYKELILPPLSPPAVLFPIVWSILYAVMGISAYIVCFSAADSGEKKAALTLYAAQLLVNFSWSIVFFRFRAVFAAAAVIVALTLLVAAIVVLFYRIRRIAGVMNIPYLLWVAFATYLNIGILILNR